MNMTNLDIPKLLREREELIQTLKQIEEESSHVTQHYNVHLDAVRRLVERALFTTRR